ncbi:serine/threonine-protein kinase [Sorangium sp. So ce448]|uniref:serine/threonine-protein kinase n=1 Tax=Sorangium sp. So ce448 TaxID=3133314 RepID=UPI003F5DBC62
MRSAEPRGNDLVAGRYQVIRRLGAGGMGEVHEALDMRAPGRRVALKVLDAALADDPRVAARFLREAETASAIRHPGVVSIHGVETDPARGPVVVMELLEGTSLDRVLAQRLLGAEEAAALGIEVCEALAAAHACGVVHRDIKPGNLLLLREPCGGASVKVLDFGIASAAGAPALTAPGEFLGTPTFASPEQLAADPAVDARSDVYSLGATLFAAVTGGPPRPHPDAELRSPERIREALARSGAPAPFLRAVEVALAPRPDERHASARAMAAALREALGDGAARLTGRLRALSEPTDIVDAPRTARGRMRRPRSPEETADAGAGAPPRPRSPEETADAGAGAPPRPRGPEETADAGAGAGAPRRSLQAASAPRAAAAVLVLAGALACWAAGKDAPPPALQARRAAAALSSPAVAARERALDGALERTCRSWGRALTARQHDGGGFSGIRQAPPAAWDTAQQLYALLVADRACGGILAEPARRAALGFLHASRGEHGWAGAPTHAGVVQATTVAAAWAALAFAGAGDADGAARALDVLTAAQHADGGFALGAGPGASPASAGYPTVMALWALVEAGQALPASSAARGRAAGEGAAAYLRRALAGDAAPGHAAAVRGVAGLLEQAAWVLWRARAAHPGAEDAGLAAPLAAELIARCSPEPDASAPRSGFTCARRPNDDGSVKLDLRQGAEPIGLSTFWFPWAGLASAALAAEPAALDGPTRGRLASLARWAEAHIAASPELDALEAYVLSEHLLAASVLLEQRRGRASNPSAGAVVFGRGAAASGGQR